MRPLFALLAATTAASLGAASYGVVADLPPEPQTATVWSPEPGWQVVQDHPVSPDVVVVGMFGERWVDPNAPPVRGAGGSSAAQRSAKAQRRADTANMPRLVLTCENGATALTIIRPPKQLERVERRPTQSPRGESAFAMDGDGTIALVFDDGERIDIDLRNTPRRAEPIYLPDPFDTIQRLLRQEALYYYEITRGRYVTFSIGGEWSPVPDSVFHLEGLAELLDATRDPCGWGA